MGGRFRHFRCVTVRNDGLRTSLMLHTKVGGGWDLGFLDALRVPASP